MKSRIIECECPFCGTKAINKNEFLQRTGIEIEKTLKWNGELKVILKLGELVIEGQKRTGQDMMDKEKLLELMKEEHNRLEENMTEEHNRLEENRKNIAKEQKETLKSIAKERKQIEVERKQLSKEREQLGDIRKEIDLQRDNLVKLKEKTTKVDSMKIPKEIIKQVKEIQTKGEVSLKEVKETLQKMIHNVKTTGTLQETQLTRRLKSLNTGDKIEHLGGPDKEDIMIRVKENNKEIGKIKLDSKNVKRWDKKFVEQMEKYLNSNNIDFGIIATTTMPKSAAGMDFYWDEKNILIVDQSKSEAVYLICRYMLSKNAEYSNEYAKKAKMLKENEKMIEAVKKVLEKASFREYLHKISEEIREDNNNIDALESYFNQKLKWFRCTNKRIMDQISMALDNDDALQKALAESSA